MLNVIHDFDIEGAAMLKTKTEAPLSVDPNAVLALSIALQGFQSIARR